MPGATDLERKVSLHYIKSSSSSAHILNIPTFPPRREKSNFSKWRRLILTLKTELIYLLLSGHSSLRNKNKTVLAIQNELIYGEASWEFSLLNKTRL